MTNAPNNPSINSPQAIPVLYDAKQIKQRLLMQVGALLAITFFAVITSVAVDQQFQNMVPEGITFPSVFNHKPSGTSGALEVVNKAGFHGQEWVLPYRQLPTVHGALIIISPSESLAEFEVNQILDWVKQGNELVYLDHFAYKVGRKILDPLGFDAKEGTPLVDSPITTKEKLAPTFQHVPDLVISAENRLTGASALVSDASGTVFTELKHGKGRILLGTSPSLVSNRRLSSENSWPNFQFLVNWLGKSGDTVFFDERCHGFSRNANVFIYLLRGSSGLVVAQLLLTFFIGIISASQRFGRTEPLVNVRKISNLEFINGLANAYQRAKANTATLEIIGQSFRTKLCKAMSVSPHESNEHIRNAVTSSTLLTEDAQREIDGFLRDYQAAIERRDLSESELRGLITRCDKITERLSQAMKTDQAIAGVQAGQS